MASEPDQWQPAPERQGEEQPPDEYSPADDTPDESRMRRVVRKAADVAVHVVAAVVENLTP